MVGVISQAAPEIGVEYDCSYAENGRKIKWFEQGLAFKARQFYTAQDKAGKNPKVINPNSNGDGTMSHLNDTPVIETTDMEPETAVQDTSVKHAKKATAKAKPNVGHKKASEPAKKPAKAAAKPAKKAAVKKGGKAPAKKARPAASNNWDTKDVVWTEKKKTLFKAMGHVGATGKAFRKASDIAKATKGALTEDQVARQLTPKFELVSQGYVKVADEGEGRTYALTSKGTSAIKSFA